MSIFLQQETLILLINGFGSKVVPTSAGLACTQSLGNKVVHKILLNKFFLYKRQSEKDKQTIKSFDDVFKNANGLLDNLLDKNEHDSLCNIFTEHLVETKNKSFCESTI